MSFDSPIAPFLAELRKEVAATRDDFALWLNTLGTASAEDPALFEALESYAGQVDRLGQTGQMIGLEGVHTWCQQLLLMLPDVVMQEGPQRAQLAQHLTHWPPLLDLYLQQPSELDPALALAEYLTGQPWPNSPDEVQQVAIIEALVAPPVIPEGLLGELESAAAPVEISAHDVSLTLPEDADQQVYHAFIDEAPANVEMFAHLAQQIAAGHGSVEDMRNAKRIAHSFKGSANIVGIRGIAALGHHTEDILEYFEQQSKTPPAAIANTLVRASDCLSQMVGHLRGDEEAPTDSYAVLSEVVHWANLIRSGEIEAVDFDAMASTPVPMATTMVSPPSAAPTTAAPTTPAPATAAPEGEAQASLRVPVRTVDELHRLVGEMTSRIARLESQLTNAGERTRALVAQNLAVQQRVLDMEKLVMLRGLSLKSTDGGEEGALDPLELDQYNELHGATRALVEVTADADEMARTVEGMLSNVRAEVVQQTLINKDLQHQVVSTRLTPVSTLSARLTRNVRQTCQQTGKQAELEIVGGSILVDGDVLNKLADPLLHLLRNAVDHGLEMPDERVAMGKPAAGTVKLTIARQGSNVIVHVRDDGRGLDYDRIRSKAIERNLIAADASLSRQDLARLILLPGFSTRDAVSEISGRGVGMDVVASRIADLKGTVEISSEPGQGSDITLRLQASLVTQHVVLVETAGQLFAIPTHQIVEAIPAGLGEISVAGDANTQSPAWRMRYRERAFPVQNLAPLTGAHAEGLTSDRIAKMPVIVILTTDGESAVVVDGLVTSREVMVKNLGRHLPRVHGVAGVTLLGDGTVVPLLNLYELLAAPLAVTAAASQLAADARRQARRVLVVDDSLSVRKSLVQLLEDATYEVAVAGDGHEAVREIARFNPHVVCTDLEMPNMNGLELTEHLRLKDATRELPIIMITSRSMDKHREMAKRAGVDYYVTKPYTDAELLKTVQDAYQRTHAAAAESTAAA